MDVLAELVEASEPITKNPSSLVPFVGLYRSMREEGATRLFSAGAEIFRDGLTALVGTYMVHQSAEELIGTAAIGAVTYVGVTYTNLKMARENLEQF